jgi:hypothetical protein
MQGEPNKCHVSFHQTKPNQNTTQQGVWDHNLALVFTQQMVILLLANLCSQHKVASQL